MTRYIGIIAVIIFIGCGWLMYNRISNLTVFAIMNELRVIAQTHFDVLEHHLDTIEYSGLFFEDRAEINTVLEQVFVDDIFCDDFSDLDSCKELFDIFKFYFVRDAYFRELYVFDHNKKQRVHFTRGDIDPLLVRRTDEELSNKLDRARWLPGKKYHFIPINKEQSGEPSLALAITLEQDDHTFAYVILEIDTTYLTTFLKSSADNRHQVFYGDRNYVAWFTNAQDVTLAGEVFTKDHGYIKDCFAGVTHDPEKFFAGDYNDLGSYVYIERLDWCVIVQR